MIIIETMVLASLCEQYVRIKSLNELSIIKYFVSYLQQSSGIFKLFGKI